MTVVVVFIVGCVVMSLNNLCSTFRENLMVSYSKAERRVPCTFLHLKVRLLDCLETSGISYPIVRHIAEERTR